MWTNQNGNSIIDPYQLDPTVAPHDNREINGLTKVSPVLAAGKVTLNVIIISDSLLTNSLSTDPSPPVYHPTNVNPAGAKLLQMGNLWSGEIFMGAELFVGAGPSQYEFAGFGFTSAHPFARCFDEMLTAGNADRIIAWSIGVGGATAADWAAAGVLNRRIIVTGKRIQSMGLDAAQTITIICLGTNDTGLDYFNGTNVFVPAYQTNMQSVIDTCRNNGLSGPILLDRATWVYAPSRGDTQGGLAPGTPYIVTALANLVSGNAGVYDGVNLNAFDNSYRADNVHFNFTTGLPAISSAHKTVIVAHL